LNSLSLAAGFAQVIKPRDWQFDKLTKLTAEASAERIDLPFLWTAQEKAAG